MVWRPWKRGVILPAAHPLRRTAYVLFEDLTLVYDGQSPPVSTVYVAAQDASALSGIKTALERLGFSSGSRQAGYPPEWPHALTLSPHCGMNNGAFDEMLS